MCVWKDQIVFGLTEAVHTSSFAKITNMRPKSAGSLVIERGLVTHGYTTFLLSSLVSGR